jgi:hypothetical protein
MSTLSYMYGILVMYGILTMKRMLDVVDSPVPKGEGWGTQHPRCPNARHLGHPSSVD